MARRLLLAVSAYAVIALVVVAWGWLLTHPLEGPVDGMDDDAARWFAGERRGLLNPVAAAGTFLGETVVGLAVGAVVAVVAGLALRSWIPAVLVTLANAGDGGIYWLGTHADPRDRPPVQILDPGLAPTHSFPSGHVGTAVAVYGAAAILLALWLRTRRGRTGGARCLVVLLAVIPLFVAVSRLYQGAHHLTDVGTSLLYGTLWLAVVAAVLVRPRATAAAEPVPRSARGDQHTPVPHR
jgi:undecaprenyl-diphosphatase